MGLKVSGVIYLETEVVDFFFAPVFFIYTEKLIFP